jgi:hypothetical protein
MFQLFVCAFFPVCFIWLPGLVLSSLISLKFSLHYLLSLSFEIHVLACY